jgi:N-acetylmuramate 1-kinase
LNHRLPIHEFIREFLNNKGFPVNGFECRPLAGDGSIRMFSRLSCPCAYETFIVMENKPSSDYLKKENSAYLMIGRHLSKKGLPVPEIYHYDLDNGWFILEDMGDVKLQDEIKQRCDSRLLLENVVELLLRQQTRGAEGFKRGWCCQTDTYDRLVMRKYETDYFRDSFLSNFLEIKTDWPELEEPFERLSQTASLAECRYFLHRDFQSRNIMICRDEFGILDWQGGRIGPLEYDLASFLIDPYMGLSSQDKHHLYGQYVSLLKKNRVAGAGSFERYFPYLAIQRNLQILGAFAHLTKNLGKTYFKEYIPPAVNSLCQLLDDVADPKLSLLTQLVHDIAIGHFKEPESGCNKADETIIR